MKKDKHPKLNVVQVVMGEGEEQIITDFLGSSNEKVFLSDPMKVFGENRSGSVRKHKKSLQQFDIDF